MKARAVVLLVCGLATLPCCKRGDRGPAPADAAPWADARPPARTPPLDSAVPTTVTRVLVPRHARERGRFATVASELDRFEREGWGALEDRPGEPLLARWPPGVKPAAPGPNARRLARVLHVSDVHITDDESPGRVTMLDDDTYFAGAYRPQESLGCRLLDSAVRTINRLHTETPIDRVVFTGDNTDNAQTNELGWLLGVLAGGAPVTCDSGQPDDPTPGPSNDGKDPFLPQGLVPPWSWVTGNHDVLIQGTFPVTAMEQAKVAGGPRSDAKRLYVSRDSLVRSVTAHVEGARVAATQRAYYTSDLPGTPVRLLVLDTAAETGAAGGLVRNADLEELVKPELARAASEGKWVLLAAHHPLDLVGDGSSGGGGGLKQPDAVPTAKLEAALSARPAIGMLVGHGHRHRVRRFGREPQAIWEVETGALVDWPSQMRLVEVWDEDNGMGSLRSTIIDLAVSGDRLGARAQMLAALDYTTGGSPGGMGTAADRNVVLFFQKPR